MRAVLPFLIAMLVLPACGDDDSPAVDAGADAAGDEFIQIDGLDGPVGVYFDEAGILHLRCQSDADCYAAEGYFHASHRFFEMDLRRRLARGRLSELVGTITLDTDLRYRTLLSTRDGGRIEEQMWEAASPATRAAIEAYSRGVNAWLDDLRNGENGAQMSPEYDFFLIEKRFDEWEPLDSVASFLPVIDGLTNGSAQEIAVGEAFAALDTGAANDLYGLRPASPSTTLAASGVLASSTDLDGAHQRLAGKRGLLEAAAGAAGPVRPRGSIGSNNWIVGPSKTGGAALLANDPHLPLSNPAIWYLVHLDSKSQGGSLHVAGASYPGLPGVLFGQNESIAWGVTTANFDQTDVYVETLTAGGTAVSFNGQDVPIVETEQSFEVSGQDTPTVKTVRFVPHHGPILAMDTEAGTAMTMRWTGQDADTDLDVLTLLPVATTVDEARAAIAASVTTVGQNFVVIDTAGSLGWFPYNRVPERPWAATTPAWLPLPGDGSAEWGDFIAYEELPQIVDPPAGFIATANNDMTGALADGDPSNDDQAAMQSYVAMGYRHERIAMRLEARDDHDLASMQSIQADVHSLLGARTVPAILTAVEGATLTEAGEAVRAALVAWDFECPTGLDGVEPGAAKSADGAASIGCAAFHVAWGQMLDKVFGDEIEAAGLDRAPRHPALVFALVAPETLSQGYWDDVSTEGTETEAATLAAALDAAGAWLTEELGPDPDDWRWGRIHTVTLRGDLFDDAGIADYNVGPFVNDGGIATVDVAPPRSPKSGSYEQAHGASLRLACAADEAIACTVELPGGQRNLAGDPHFADLMQRWLVNEPTKLEFSIDAAEAAATETVELRP